MKPRGKNYKRAADTMKKEGVNGVVVYAGYWYFKVLKRNPVTGKKEVTHMHYMG